MCTPSFSLARSSAAGTTGCASVSVISNLLPLDHRPAPGCCANGACCDVIEGAGMASCPKNQERRGLIKGEECRYLGPVGLLNGEVHTCLLASRIGKAVNQPGAPLGSHLFMPTLILGHASAVSCP